MTPSLQAFLTLTLSAVLLATTPAAERNAESLNVLFIGNSYTGRHNLSQVVKEMAEAGNPGLTFYPTTVIYGGRTLADHWRLGTQNIVNIAQLTEPEEKATIASLKKAIADNPEDSHAKNALKRHQELLANLESQRTKWDVVILQSYRDDLEGEASRYAEFAPKFAKLAHAQGARVILYETTPTTQNFKPRTDPPDPAPIHTKAKAIAALADRIDADAAPMSLVALRCQTERPDLTLRFINDGHLNHTMAYLTACSLYAALFDRSPEGLSVDSITDIRFLDNDPKNKEKDRDGNPITRTFSDKDRADLQRIAWEGFNEFQALRKD
jgi:rubrerythrin